MTDDNRWIEYSPRPLTKRRRHVNKLHGNEDDRRVHLITLSPQDPKTGMKCIKKRTLKSLFCFQNQCL